MKGSYFDFDLPKDVRKYFKHEIESNIKHHSNINIVKI